MWNSDMNTTINFFEIYAFILIKNYWGWKCLKQNNYTIFKTQTKSTTETVAGV